MKKTYNLSTSILMRIDSTYKINDCYNNHYLTFSCPANWLHYSIKCGNNTIGDTFECVFAQLPKGDSRINSIVDSKGKPMASNLLILQNTANNMCLLRFMPTILTPTLCFFSFSAKKIFESKELVGEGLPWFAYNLDEYRNRMKIEPNKSSYLFITRPTEFFDDLMMSIPVSVEKEKNNLTDSRYYSKFNSNEPIIFGDMDYHSIQTKSSCFFSVPKSGEELFWKLSEYDYQSEVRIAIRNINFLQEFKSVEDYDYTANLLKVHLPNLQKYSVVAPADEIHALLLEHYDKNTQSGDISLLRIGWDELLKRIGYDSPVGI